MHNKPALNKQDSLERLFKLSCFAVICCGFISCLLLLFTTGLIEDEIFSILVSNPHTSYLSLFKDFYIKDVTPPLYLSLLYLYNHLGYFINSALWFRLPSFIFWFLSAGAVWFYLPKAAGQKVRLIFISFFFLSPSLIFILTEARTYGFSVFLGTVFICAALNMAYALCLKRDLRLKDKTVFFICGLLLCFAHYFGAVFFVCTSAALIIYAFALKRDVKIFVCGLFIITALLMLWLVPNYAALKQAGVFDGNWWSEKDPLWYGLTDFFNIIYGSDYALCALALLLTAGLWQLKKEKDKAEVLIALLPLAVYLPAVLGLLVLSFKINIMQARYFLVFTPLAFLFCAALINKAFKSGFAAYILWFIFLLLCAQSSLKFTAKFCNNPFPPKHFAQYYMDNYNGKTVLLATLYPYSQKLLPDIYDFYFKNYFKQDVKIYNLLADEAKYKGFIKDKDTIVYVPDCFVKTEDALLKFNLNKVHQDYTFNYCVFTGK